MSFKDFFVAVFQHYNLNNIISYFLQDVDFTVCIFYMTKYDMQKLETLTLRSADFLLLDNDGELMPEFLYQVMRV